MLTVEKMIDEAVRRLGAGEDAETVIRDVLGPVLDAASYAAQKSRDLDSGDGCDTDDLIRACKGCADVIGEEAEEYEGSGEEEE